MNNAKKLLYIFITCVLLLAVQAVCAEDAFKNNILKADISKNSLGAVKITLYTNKPYNDSVIVKKKNDYEYVILLPETSNSLTAKPALNSVSDVVKKIEVKTQQYQNNIKGYTKILISTNKAIEITPNVLTLPTSHYTISESDYRELLAQASKAKNVQKIQKTETKKAVTEVKKIAKAEQKSIVSVDKTKKFVKSLNKAKDSLKEKSKAVKPENKQKNVKVSPKEKKNVQTKPKVIVSKPAVTIIKPMAKQVEKIVDSTSPQKPEFQAPVIQPYTAPQSIEKPVQAQVETQPSEVQNYIHTIKTLIKDNLYYALGACFAFFIFLLIIAKKMTRNIKRQKEIFISHLDEKPVVPTDYSENITDDMTWKEKFQTYVDTAAAPDAEENIVKTGDISQNENIDELFNADKPSKSSISEHTDDTEINQQDFQASVDSLTRLEADNKIADTDSGFDYDDDFNYIPDDEDVSIDELFGYDEELSQSKVESDSAPFIQQQKADNTEQSTVKSEFLIDVEKGFYLVDYGDTTALVGRIDEEIFLLKQFNKKINDRLQARVNERIGNSTSYMTKVGDFKGVVEVTPEKMNLLIEL